ncbi:uncharacterized protein C2845_PM18G01380 [Panicum miliaceum]|uniref:Uncharacterized protein n=1 Tax=Panicum miliaceum TaxID=4540 RepID=A0A3L6PIJ0_PANMI|nr:uncharacterized protein C2845_PM18G01380 [Panicum miliaceum]
MRLLPWPNHPDPAAPPRLDDDVPVAVGTHLHVAAGGDDDDAESTASSERSHRTLPVHADEADPAGDGGLQAVDPRHHEVAGRGSGSEDGWSWSESDGGEPAEAEGPGAPPPGRRQKAACFRRRAGAHGGRARRDGYDARARGARRVEEAAAPAAIVARSRAVTAAVTFLLFFPQGGSNIPFPGITWQAGSRRISVYVDPGSSK